MMGIQTLHLSRENRLFIELAAARMGAVVITTDPIFQSRPIESADKSDRWDETKAFLLDLIQAVDGEWDQLALSILRIPGVYPEIEDYVQSYHREHKPVNPDSPAMLAELDELRRDDPETLE